MVDRILRQHPASTIALVPRLHSLIVPQKRRREDAFEEADEKEAQQARNMERWKFDSDGLEPDADANRILVDDMTAPNMRWRAHLLLPSDLSLILSTNENTRGHFDYRHVGSGGTDSPSTHFSPGLRGASARRRGSISRPVGAPPTRLATSLQAVSGTTVPPTPVSTGSGVNHIVPPLPSLSAPSTAQQLASRTDQSLPPALARDSPNLPSPASHAAPVTNVAGRALNGTPVALPAPPLPSLSQTSPTLASKQSGIRLGTLI
jgi:hypothetical protein